MSNNDLMLNFGADVSEVESALGRMSDALGDLTPSVENLSMAFNEKLRGAGSASLAEIQGRLTELGNLSDQTRGKIDNLGVSFSSLASQNFSRLAPMLHHEQESGGGDESDRVKLARADANQQVAIARASLAELRTIYDGDVQLRQISTGEKIALTRKAVDEEYALERDLLQRQTQIDGLKVEQKNALNMKLLQLDMRHQRESIQLANSAAQDNARLMFQMADGISSSMGRGFMDMIRGTRNFQTVAQGMATSLLQTFIQTRVKMVTDWAAGMAQKTLFSEGAETAQTAAAQAGAAARGSIAGAEAAGSLAEKAASVVKSIMASAGEAFAGVFGFLSPVMGPAAAGPAAAAQASVAGMASVASFDVGAWNIPHDQLALVHQGELIMTASQGEAFRGLLTNGGAQSSGGGGSVNVHAPVSLNLGGAMDGASVASFFKQNEKQIMKSIGSAVRSGAHLGVKGLGYS